MTWHKDSVRHCVSGFGWGSPGEMRVFESDEREQAVSWVAG
jgi:hypothetical protein